MRQFIKGSLIAAAFWGATALGGSQNYCNAGDVLIEVGERFPSIDGCNQCYCDESGGFACTEIACSEPAEINGCAQKEIVLPYGEQFPSVDGCNTCTCEDDGTLSCTEIACDVEI